MNKFVQTTDKECHDCGQIGPEWCSINHGVLLCDECCSVHLSLGRHISQIKSLKRSFWSPVQLNLINELISNGANLIWEYSLRDPQNKFPKKKPTAKDSLAIKSEFIRAKYQQMNFINRIKDETNGTFEDLNLQLHSIVRTDNITTCLRFLSQGADPNFRNPESGTSSMHVAASRGQSNQIELLFIFGGDPALVDASGFSPNEHAILNGFNDLADRLIELQYELIDRFITFIGGKRINHKIEQNFILPELNEKFEKSEQILFARQKLQQLPDSIFEDLTMDVFDEIDRRELKTIWFSQVEKTFVSLHVVPFLPVNPSLSPIRNQGRQKLGRYESKDFHLFLFDILNEIRRRFLTKNSNDELVYDKVASDDENQFVKTKRIKIDEKTKILDSNLKSRLINTETQIKYLICSHNDLKNEFLVLNQMVKNFQNLFDEKFLKKIQEKNQFENVRKSNSIIESDYDNATTIDVGETSSTNFNRSTREKRLSRSVQKFPQIDENFQILNLDSTTNLNKRDASIKINRSRSFSAGRSKTISNENLEKFSKKITKQIEEFFHLIKQNQKEHYGSFAQRINNSIENFISFSERFCFNEDFRTNLNVLLTSGKQLLFHSKIDKKYSMNENEFLIDDCFNIALATRNILSLYEKIS